MKNLPDKIYLNLGDMTEEELNDCDFNDLAEVTWSEDDVQGRNVEYVRTDAFIEKAVKWLEDNAIEYWGTEAVDNGMMIDDFKKYMKGEKV